MSDNIFRASASVVSVQCQLLARQVEQRADHQASSGRDILLPLQFRWSIKVTYSSLPCLEEVLKNISNLL